MIINRMGGFVHAFLALFLQAKLGMEEHKIAQYIIIMGVTSAFSPFIGGKIADLRGRKSIYILAQTLAAALLIPCGLFVNSKPDIIPILLIVSSIIGNIIGPINNSIVADLTKSENERKKAYALMYLGVNIGVAIGPMIGGFLFENFITFFFIGEAIATFVSVLLVACFIKESKPSVEEMISMNGKEAFDERISLKVLLNRPELIAFLFFTLLNSIVYAQSSFGIPLHLQSIFNDGASKYGILMSFNAAICIILTLPLTALLKKVHPINNMIIASVFYSLGFGMIGFAGKEYSIYFLSVLLWTIGEIIITTNQSLFFLSFTPVNHRGRFSSILSFAGGAGFIISPLMKSMISSRNDVLMTWILFGIISLMAAGGMLMTRSFLTRLESTKLNSSL